MADEERQDELSDEGGEPADGDIAFDDDGGDVDVALGLESGADEGQALCLRCLTPIDTVLDHYCPKCGYAVGQLTPYIPFVRIQFDAQIWSNLWQRAWYEPEARLWSRAMALWMIALAAPVMLCGLPFVIRDKWRSRKLG